MNYHKIFVVIFSFIFTITHAQDSTTTPWSLHYQMTTVTQWHADMNVPYEGPNSLKATENDASSLTATLFLAWRLTNNFQIVFNPEIAGGKGLSSALGLGGFSNGECFRIGNPSPTIYVARALAEYYINLNHEKTTWQDDVNQSQIKISKNFIKIFGGKFSLMDYVEKNIYSQDPRIHFLNWTYMTSGGWDYAANTRGYTVGLGIQAKINNNTYTFIATQLPLQANGMELDNNIDKCFALQLSFRKDFQIFQHDAMFETILFFNKANMGNYNTALKNTTIQPDITTTRNYNNTKYGFLFNSHFTLSKKLGFFAKASWNDGNNETWAFTEIDHSALIGLVYKFHLLLPLEFGLGHAVNGLSTPHQNYLKAGGLGFMLGDGTLNYGLENITESYIKFKFWNNQIEFSPHYQYILNPGYNKDRPFVHIWGLRTHFAF